MLRAILIAAVMAAFLFLAPAGQARSHKEMRFKRPPPADMIQSCGVAEGIAHRYIEAQAWCERPVPKAAPGSIVIYYARDGQGVCRSRVKAGR